MRRPKLGTLAKSFDALLMEKRSLIEKEEGLIRRLNNILSQLGYRVERAGSGGPIRSRKPSPSPQTGASNAKAAHHQAPETPKRRGRPPLRKVA